MPPLTSLFNIFRTTFSDFAMKNGRDPRFKGIEKMREREAIFNEFIADLRARQKERHRSHAEKVSPSLMQFIYCRAVLPAEG